MGMDENAAIRRFRLALDLYEAGEAMMRRQLERRHPGAPPEEIERMLVEWLRERPGAPNGDSAGRPVPWPRAPR